MNTVFRMLFPQRIGRLSFGVRLLVCIASCLALSLTLLTSWDFLKGALPGIETIPGFSLVIPLIMIYFTCVLLPRVRDTGLHGAFALIALVPPINVLCLLALLFIPSRAFATSPRID
jgi:uncharacterized membrane protein YhaH (DUF805 family)